MKSKKNKNDKRYYSIAIAGYGGEGRYIKISRSAYEFWHSVIEQFGEGDLLSYLVDSEDDTAEFENIQTVPSEAQFMRDGDGVGLAWYDHPNEITGFCGVSIDGWITVDEISDSDPYSEVIAQLIDEEEIHKLAEDIDDETDGAVELIDYDPENDFSDVDYYAYIIDHQKGSFFEGIVEVVGDFDPKKFKFEAKDYPHYGHVINCVNYDDGEEFEPADTDSKEWIVGVCKRAGLGG